ncbi:hypothetical protein [Actinacidiphila bryophytorum]|uniref:Large membrane protein n=1 Tax=Actinacidiphila bryophytorum TaxID=1436133 RepID=A0A9W4E7A0_9ACTN|nr:hypothetical protein [Actinacidiphila bryophytorum]MBM9436326.1 hypothetical protein [Actinacidiphila bryophytorum]MBN6546986.1 hypothetical protein [Actinacidiphila bryophytorum]CAG7631736.1 conserved hypothetical protein [Actinacidiphila bryophytorum]
MSSEHDDHEAAHGHAGGADDDILVGGDAAEHPHDIPQRRRLTVALVAAAVLAAAGGGAYWAVAAGGGTSPSARPGSVAATATAPGGVAAGPGTVAGTGGDYRLTGTLPADGPSSAPLYRPDGGPDRAAVARLAALLGVTGAVVDDHGSWRVGSADGTGAALLVGKDAPGTWSYAANSQVTPGARRVVPPALPQVPPPAADAPADSGASTSHRAESTPPVPEQRARAAAAPVLDGLGLSGAQVDASRTAAATRTVTADPVVGGLPTHGWDTSLDIDPNGRVTGGHGRLSALVKGESQQVISAQQAYRNLSSQRIMHPDHRMSCQVPMPDKGNAAGPAVSPTLPGQDRTLPTSLPCVAPHMAPIDITGARFGLATQFVSGGGQALLPAWLFDAKPEGAAAGSVIAQPAVEQPPSQGGGSAPGTGSPGTPRVAVAAYQPHGSSLTLTFWGGICDTYSASAVETPTQVRVTVTATPMHPGAPCPDLAKSQAASVALSAPLGTRTVVDASTNSPVKAS